MYKSFYTISFLSKAFVLIIFFNSFAFLLNSFLIKLFFTKKSSILFCFEILLHEILFSAKSCLSKSTLPTTFTLVGWDTLQKSQTAKWVPRGHPLGPKDGKIKSKDEIHGMDFLNQAARTGVSICFRWFCKWVRVSTWALLGCERSRQSDVGLISQGSTGESSQNDSDIAIGALFSWLFVATSDAKSLNRSSDVNDFVNCSVVQWVKSCDLELVKGQTLGSEWSPLELVMGQKLGSQWGPLMVRNFNEIGRKMQKRRSTIWQAERPRNQCLKALFLMKTQLHWKKLSQCYSLGFQKEIMHLVDICCNRNWKKFISTSVASFSTHFTQIHNLCEWRKQHDDPVKRKGWWREG